MTQHYHHHFRKFEESLNSHPLKSSQVKAIHQKLIDTYPNCEPYIEELWPKKATVLQLKLKGEAFVCFYQIDGEIRFMEVRDLPILPMLRVLHRYPDIMSNKVQVDKGAIKHVLSGSHIMAPGLTSPGGILVPDLD